MSEAYDPTAPEGERPAGSQYLSRKDLRIIAIVLVVAILLFLPLFRMLERRAWKTQCSDNVRAINTALQSYVANHDDRLPPVFAEGDGGGYPLVFPEQKAVFTWASEISTGMSARASFFCPAATPEEGVKILSERPIDSNDVKDRERKQGEEQLTYGMYMAYGGFPVSLVPDPNQTVIIAETSNMGANGTFDPLKFTNASGEVEPYDAFAICWDNSNLMPDKSTTSVTRLAFGSSGSGARHEFATKDGSMPGIHGLNAVGASVVLRPGSQAVQQGSSITGIWAIPASYRR